MNSLLLHILIILNIGWGNNLETAMQQASQENKLVLLYFSGSDWCGPCIMLKRKVFDTEEFTVFADNHLKLVQADFPRKKKNKLKVNLQAYNDSLAEIYNKQGQFPLTLLLSPKGEVLHKWDYSRDLEVKKIIAKIQQYR